MRYAESQERADDVVLPMREWSLSIHEPGPRPLDFEAFPFQEEWYSEAIARAEEVVVMKSTQVGASAYTWRWGMRRAEQYGERVLYIFPTDDDVYDFGDDRINPAVEESDYLSRRRGTVWQKRLKQIGNGYLYLRGSKSKSKAQSVAASAIVFDEYDHLDKTNLPQIERRLTGARARGETPRVRRLGNPTTPGYGIDQAYQSSDRRVWMVTCPDCGLEQDITWDANVRWRMPGRKKVHRPGRDAKQLADPREVGRAWRACRECEAELEGEPIKRGRWVAQNPASSVIGYHATRLIVPNTDLRQIVIASRQTSPSEQEAFSSNDLGVAYSPVEASLDLATLQAACVDGKPAVQGYTGRNPVTMGVDVAGERDLSVRISEQLPNGRRRALAILEVGSFTAVARLMRNFRVSMCVVDSNPERRMAKSLRAEFLGRVVLCNYDARNTADALKIDLDPNSIPVSVTVNRTEAIDAMMDAVRQQRNIPLREPPPKYFAQMMALKRRTVLNTKGEPERVYVTTGSQGDDFAHAEVYDLIATELWRTQARVQAMRDAASGSHIPDEQLGYRRVRLDTGDDAAVADYRQGFGQ
jgi:hypothetical protein